MDIFLGAVLGIIVTVLAYLLVPVIIILTGKKFSEKEIKRIVVINAVVWSILFFLIRSSQGETKVNIAPCILWSSVAYAIMKNKCLKKDTDETAQSTTEDCKKSKESHANTKNKEITHACLSNADEQPKTYGDFNVYGKDLTIHNSLSKEPINLEKGKEINKKYFVQNSPKTTINNEDIQVLSKSIKKEYDAIDLAKELSEKCAKTVIQINRKCKENGIDYSERKFVIATFSYFFAKWAYTSKNLTFAQVGEVQNLYKEQFSEFNKVAFQDDSFKSVMENEKIFAETLEKFLNYAKDFYNSENNSFSEEFLGKYILEFVKNESDIVALKEFL